MCSIQWTAWRRSARSPRRSTPSWPACGLIQEPREKQLTVARGEAMSEPEVLIERRGCAGFLTLNRPRALNALNLGMVRAIAAALDEWERDDAVARVVTTGAGGRAFCAGGDIRLLYE